MTQPDELKKNEPLVWSSGIGTEVWALFCACIAGDLAAVERLVHKDPPLVRCQFHYRKPLYFAVRENQLAVTEFLLERDPNPIGLAVNDSLLQIARDRGYAEMETLLKTKLASRHNISSKGEPIAEAIRQHDLAKVRGLLDASPELLHVGDLRSNQPIHWAAMTRQIDVIDELLARGADINARRCDGARPIHLNNGDYHYRGRDRVPENFPKPRAIYENLRARGAYCDICTAAWFGDLDRVRQLCVEDTSLANRSSDAVTYYACSGTPLRNAAAGGHMEIVKLLLDRGADPNLPEEGIAPRGHALHSAAVRGHIEIVKLLLAHGAHPNVEVESSADTLSAALATAGYSYVKPNTEMVELLCSYGASRAVHLLAYSGDVLTGAAVFAANPALANNPEALANAAGEGQEAFVRLMLRYQPDLPRRVTFPSWSVGAKTRELNELLFHHGMNANATDWLGATALHHLAGGGNVEKATWFLDRGADLHARDEDICSTPLGWAAKFGRKEMVEFLLSRGARPKRSDDPPWTTPLAWATRRGHNEIVELLEQRGAH
ncbi:MAG TPA: ankyrin repeat domain-containing protein [Candidatus Acidoferrum sp.]|nr:ankyrin repeat domain-containing protein [Candidatus Acidoferrum sp.]